MASRPTLGPSSFLAAFLSAAGAFAGPVPNIIVDQFGYRATSPKVAVFAQPAVGTGSPSSFTPGATFEVRRVSDNALVFTGNTAQWNGGATHSQSGDRAWQGTFTAFTTPGSYYISVPGGSNPGSQSYPFQITDSVFNGVVTASQRSFYYQRCGMALSVGNGGAWNHANCHSGANQDLTAHLWVASDQGQARDVHGGWHDAGDYAKYITFTHATLWYLMHAVEWYPLGYTDGTNIPESGNGVPDMLDEVKYELDWMLRMQRASDGALHSVVGQLAFSNNPGNPANDNIARYYTGVSTSATSTGAMAFALGARLLGAYPAYTSYAVTLQNAAVSAWGYLTANPAPVNYNTASIVNASANVSAMDDARMRVAAAAELYHLTGNATYRTYFDANYNSAAVAGPVSNPPNVNDMSDASLAESLQLGMVSYCLAPGATGSVVTAIRTALRNEIEWNNLPNNPENDPYLGFMWDGHYTWGSNQLKAAWGNHLLFAVKIGANPSQDAAYLAQAEEYLHYFHGRNPLNWVYLTNMGTGGANLGASKTVRSIYHSWFYAGTTYDGNTGGGALGPAPGILAGGPNQFYAPDPSYGGTISPPQNQPPMKSYKDWGEGWPQNSWEVTENSQGYQGKYQFLLSAFAGNAQPTATPTASPTGTFPTVTSTPTRTPTSTPTPSLTPTATTCVLLLNGAETLAENGTWMGGSNATRDLSPSNATQGVSSMDVNITVGAGWNDNILRLNGFTPSVWTGVTQLRVDVYVDAALAAGAGGWKQIALYGDSSANGIFYQQISSTSGDFVAGPQTLSWTLDYPGSITSAMALSELRFILNTENAVTGHIYLDNFRLTTSCAPSPTATATRTATPSATPTSTPSSSMTATPSLTASRTPTSSSTPTATPSSSPTPTLSSSPTSTPTPLGPTPTSTATPTPTSTLTSTVSPTGTLTPVNTDTSTPTPSATATSTSSFSSTATSSPTVSSTSTASSTRTPTLTFTPTLIPSSTSTRTPTGTATPTPPPGSTPTPTMSRTATPSSTPTSTASSMASPTRTATASLTPTRSSTATLIPTSTPTAILTPTFTPTSATTPAPTAGPNPVIFPNPVGTGSVALLPQSFAGTASVTVSLYTTSFKLVTVKTFPARSNGQTVMVDLVDDRGQPLANGIYYASVAVPGSKKTVTLVVQR